MSSHSSGMISISNIANIVSIRLDRDNYLLWKSQFLPNLRPKQLLKYVNRNPTSLEIFIKDKNGTPTSVINLDYELWVEQHPLVLLWINATLTPSMLKRVVAYCTILLFGQLLAFGLRLELYHPTPIVEQPIQKVMDLVRVKVVSIEKIRIIVVGLLLLINLSHQSHVLYVRSVTELDI